MQTANMEALLASRLSRPSYRLVPLCTILALVALTAPNSSTFPLVSPSHEGRFFSSNTDTCMAPSQAERQFSFALFGKRGKGKIEKKPAKKLTCHKRIVSSVDDHLHGARIGGETGKISHVVPRLVMPSDELATWTSFHDFVYRLKHDKSPSFERLFLHSRCLFTERFQFLFLIFGNHGINHGSNISIEELTQWKVFPSLWSEQLDSFQLCVRIFSLRPPVPT